MAAKVIAIDGPAAAGKTTVGRRLAERLGWTFFDTGVLYRALALLALERGVPVDDGPALAALARTMAVRVTRASVADGRDADVLLDGRDVTWAIRAPAVDAVVSRVAAAPEVRAALVEPQRRAARNGPAVVVGRDIGTVIFPDAALKVYLDASLAERARRRAADLRARGLPASEAEVLRDLTRRDQLDSERACAPLALPADGVVISTDGLSIDEVVDRVLALWREREGGNGRKS